MDEVLNKISECNCSFEELLQYVSDDLELGKILDYLQRNNLIKKTKTGMYRKVNYEIGKVISDKSVLYVLVDGTRYKLDQNTLEGSIVSVDVNTHNNTCSLINVIDNNMRFSTGEVIQVKNKLVVYEDKKIVYVENCIPGDIISYEIEKIKGNYYAKNVKKICSKDDPDKLIKEVSAQKGIRTFFPQEVIEEAKNIKSYVDSSDILGRIDLRDLVTFTIDGNDSKDFDDALSIVKMDNGNYKVYVHIAHVSHYVKKGSLIDMEAKKRSTSHYLGCYCIPMLLNTLSNGICSLNEGVDRLTKTSEFEIDSTGKVVSYKRYNSVINSNKRMKYELVNKMFDGSNYYLKYKEELNNLKNVYLLLRKNRKKSKYIEFDVDEYEEVYKDNDIVDIKSRQRFDAEKLIEEFMLLDGRYYAEDSFSYLKAYRIHEMPKQEKLFRLINSIEDKENIHVNIKDISVEQLVNALDKINGCTNYKIYNQLILMCMKKAKFSPIPDMHYALNFEKTCQFTSPIRRYMDLVNQRIDDGVDYSLTELTELCKYASIQEKKAMELENDILKINMARFMEDKVGNSYNGNIIGVDDSKLKIQFYNGVIGIINKKVKVKDNFIFEFDNKSYTLGQEIKIVVDDVDVKKGLIKVKEQ